VVKWRIRRVTHTQTIGGERIVTHRWWLFRPPNDWQSWVAEATGTFEECVKALDRATFGGRFS